MILNENRPKSMVIQNFDRKTSNESCASCMSLADAINDKKVKIGFRTFLESEFSVENLDFWLAVQQYKKIKDKKARKTKAREIYKEYVSPSSPSQVNLDYRTQQKILKEISEDELRSADAFDEAQKCIFTIMENDSYARFVRSKYYDICSQAKRRSSRNFFRSFLPSTTRHKRSATTSCPKAKSFSTGTYITKSREV